MQILDIQVFPGRNIHSHKPVIKLKLDIDEYYKYPTKDIKDFNQRLTGILPGLLKHFCSLGYEGGFAERLDEGTYMGHVIEHSILELQTLFGYEVTYGKTRVLEEPSIYNLFYEFKNEAFAIECGKIAVFIANRLTKGIEVDEEKIFGYLSTIRTETELGPSTKAIYDEAVKRNIPVKRINNESLLRIGTGKYTRLVEAAMTDAVSCIAADIAGNKHLTKKMLSDYSIPVPFGEVFYTMDTALAYAEEIGYPVVIKPFNANQGKGVTLNIKDGEHLRDAFEEAKYYSKAVIVENYIKGRDYRILVIGGKVSAVSERIPPSVTGDGIHTVKELVDEENKNELRGDNHEKPLTKLKLDGAAKKLLSRKGIGIDYVPEAGERITLRENANLSTGGTAIDCTDLIHPYNADLAIKAAKILGLDIAGIDITTENISIPLNESGGAVIEVNAAPGLRMHIYPTSGKSRNVAKDILDMIYPAGSNTSVPIISITGTNGKTTTTRLINHTLSILGYNCGMTNTSGIYIGGKCILKGDNTGPLSANLILSNREVEVAVLETARGGIVRRGLGYDLADIGIITNISNDHLGLDGIESLDELMFVKSLVIEAVKPDGYSVLNADDKMIHKLIPRAKGNLILFSKDESNPLLKEFAVKGSKSVYVKDNSIYINDDDKVLHLIDIEEIPITFGGKLSCNIENSLAAVCALFALDIPLEAICQGLKSFRPSAEFNPGRFNIFEFNSFKVMLDYSHNPAGYKEVGNLIRKVNPARSVGIIGIPGDRDEKNIYEVGKISSEIFHKVYIKEDEDLRGREPGEVAGMLFDSMVKNGFNPESIEVVYSETNALEAAVRDASEGDFIVMLYENFEPAYNMVNQLINVEKAETVSRDLHVIQA